MSNLFFTLTQFSIVAYALVGGVFLAFSDFIMRSLAFTGGTGGVEAMQSINREVFRWVFMTLFIAMAPVSFCLAVYGATVVGGYPGTLMAVSGLVYLIGCFGVTASRNVPMNQALAGMDAALDATRDYWISQYLPRWTFWNTVRTVACLLSAGLLLISMLLAK